MSLTKISMAGNNHEIGNLFLQCIVPYWECVGKGRQLFFAAVLQGADDKLGQFLKQGI
jgi:hypothetical protein